MWKPARNQSKGVSAGVPQPSDGVIDFTWTVPDDAMYGPYVVVTETTFGLLDGQGNLLFETARVVNLFDVVPDGGQAETALYWVLLEAWMPDWS